MNRTPARPSPSGRDEKARLRRCIADPALDRPIDEAAIEMRPERREHPTADAQRRVAQRRDLLALHRQMPARDERSQVHVPIPAANRVRVEWIRID